MDKVACDIDRLNIKVELLELFCGKLSLKLASIEELVSNNKSKKEGEALPCPFCGNQPEFREEYRGWIIWCADFLCVEHRYGHETIESAVADWNSRKVAEE